MVKLVKAQASEHVLLDLGKTGGTCLKYLGIPSSFNTQGLWCMQPAYFD
jgi:hypothetical protein